MTRRAPYRLPDGTRVPSVTTIIGRFKESGGLLYWANRMGLDGKTLDEARDAPATAGTLAHALVEASIHGRDEPDLDAPDEIIAAARRAFENFQRWRDISKIEFAYTEYPLVSESVRFGGRFDAIAKMDGRLYITDFKTGSLYADHLLQVAAYQILWRDNYPDTRLEDAVHLLSFRREDASFTHSFFEGLAEERKLFLQLREIFDRIKKVERRVK